MQHTEPRPFINSLRIISVAAFIASFVLFGVESRASTSPQFTEYDVAKSCPADIALGPDGNMWFTEACTNGELGSGKIGRIAPSGEIIELDVPVKEGSPSYIQPGPKNELWFSWFAAGTIGSISVSGAVKEYPVANGTTYGLTFASDGNMWFGDLQGNAVGRLTPDGTTTKFPLPHEGQHPEDLTAGKDNSIWFTEDYGTIGAIGRITTQGQITEYPLHPARPLAPRRADYPAVGGIAVATDGAVWFTESNLNRIAKRSPAGTITEYSIPTPNSRAVGVVAGTRGDVWFTEGYGNKFGHVTAQGKITEYKIPSPDSGPSGIALDASGNVWVAEQSANKILKASIPH